MRKQNTTYAEVMHLLLFRPKDRGPAESNTTGQSIYLLALLKARAVCVEVYAKEIKPFALFK